ncbi:MAG: TRAP transporter small permease [Synergistaceae bacterium]|nr:TRAP transporter small permease [Synergistaceae bacterium]
MKKLLHLMDDKFEELFLVATLSFSVILIFAQVVMRYVFRNSIFWSEELARYLFIWQAWIAASFATKHSRHINLDIIVNLCSPNVKKILFWAAHIIWLGFALYMAWLSARLTNTIFTRKTVSAAMQIRMGWVYLAVPFGCALMSIRLMQNLAARLRAGGKGVV